jgi:channel protein (hemolysin III family)
MKFWFTGRFAALSMAIYIAMGWLVMIALRPMLHAVPLGGLWLLLAGGLCYTGGTVCTATCAGAQSPARARGNWGYDHRNCQK